MNNLSTDRLEADLDQYRTELDTAERFLTILHQSHAGPGELAEARARRNAARKAVTQLQRKYQKAVETQTRLKAQKRAQDDSRAKLSALIRHANASAQHQEALTQTVVRASLHLRATLEARRKHLLALRALRALRASNAPETVKVVAGSEEPYQTNPDGQGIGPMAELKASRLDLSAILSDASGKLTCRDESDKGLPKAELDQFISGLVWEVLYLTLPESERGVFSEMRAPSKPS